MPEFHADASLGARRGRPMRSNGTAPSANAGQVVPQQQFAIGSDPDLGAYLRCRANGGGELVCRFFGGLPPFTIGGRLF